VAVSVNKIRVNSLGHIGLGRIARSSLR